MNQYLIYDRDKAAFINKVNKYLKQLEPSTELSSSNFVDIPGSGDEDKSIFISNTEMEDKLVDTLISKGAFSYKVKRINLKEIVKSVK